MTTTDVEVMRSLCREWQERLGLLHWHINLRIERHFNMPDNIWGNCSWTLSTLKATIKILHPEDYDPDLEGLDERDMEQILVHEILHLHFAPFDETPKDSDGNFASSRGIMQEQAIEQISQALVNLKRSDAVAGDPL